MRRSHEQSMQRSQERGLGGSGLASVMHGFDSSKLQRMLQYLLVVAILANKRLVM